MEFLNLVDFSFATLTEAQQTKSCPVEILGCMELREVQPPKGSLFESQAKRRDHFQLLAGGTCSNHLQWLGVPAGLQLRLLI